MNVPVVSILALALVGGVGCTAPSPTAEVLPDPADSSSQADSPVPEAPSEPNQTYDGPAFGYPLQAQYPSTLAVDGGCAGEGCGFSFTFVSPNPALAEADLHVFLPAGAATAADQAPFVTGPDGLIANAGWAVTATTEGSEQFPYPWVEQVIDITIDADTQGHILLGQAHGQAVQVLLQYPIAEADAYWEAATPVLSSLAFEPSLLPLSVSTEGE